ncbi:hypothetical protein AAFO92_12645 [Roseovarius sp. CAU 1744]|uniref:hypothetical protein n=1 Tax=Roseovarius sp. CAU 1744 TaxID=3140368 RepID=UPI00325B011D
MTESESPQAGWVLKSIAIPAYIGIGAFFTYFSTKILFAPILHNLLVGKVEAVQDILTGYLGIAILFMIIYLPFRVLVWLIVKLYNYANSRSLRAKRKEPPLPVQLFGKRFLNNCLSLGAVAGLLTYCLEEAF